MGVTTAAGEADADVDGGMIEDDFAVHDVDLVTVDPEFSRSRRHQLGHARKSAGIRLGIAELGFDDVTAEPTGQSTSASMGRMCACST